MPRMGLAMITASVSHFPHLGQVGLCASPTWDPPSPLIPHIPPLASPEQQRRGGSFPCPNPALLHRAALRMHTSSYVTPPTSHLHVEAVWEAFALGQVVVHL